MYVAVEEKSPELFQLFDASHFLVKLGVHDQVEVVVDLVQLCNVFILHFPASSAFSAGVVRLREANLVDYDVVDVNLKFGKLDCKTLCLVETEELWNAYCDESCLFRVLKLIIDLHNLLFHHIERVK